MDHSPRDATCQTKHHCDIAELAAQLTPSLRKLTYKHKGEEEAGSKISTVGMKLQARKQQSGLCVQGILHTWIPSSVRKSPHHRAYPVQWYWSWAAASEWTFDGMSVLRKLYSQRKCKKPIDRASSDPSSCCWLQVYFLCSPQLDNSNVSECRYLRVPTPA